MSVDQWFLSIQIKHKFLLHLMLLIAISFICLFPVDGVQADERNDKSSSYQTRIYVPSSELDSVFGSDRKGILLPMKEFEELEIKADENGKTSPDTVNQLSITGIKYHAEILNETIAIRTEIQLQQFEEGWQSILLPAPDLFVEEASQGKTPALLGRTKNGLQLFHQKAGKFSVTLKLIAPISSLGSDQLASFHLIPSSNASFEIRIPENKFLYIDGLKSSSPEIVEKEKVFRIETGGQEQLELRITDKKADQVSDVLLFGSTGIDISLNPGTLNWKAETTTQVFGQQIDLLHFTIPASLEITEVKSHGLESWNLVEVDDDRLQVELKYRQPFTGARQVHLKGIQSLLPADEWMIPSLTLKNSTSHIGLLNISYPASYRFQKYESEGVKLNEQDQQNRNPAPQGTRVIRRYSIWNEDFQFPFKLEKKSHIPQLKVHQILEIQENGLDVTYLGKIYPISSDVYDFNVDIPLEWNLTSAMLGDLKLNWQVVSTEAGSQQVRFTLDVPIRPLQEQSIFLTAHHDPEDWPLEDKEVELQLPEFKVSGMDRISGSYIIKSEEDMIVVPVEIKGMIPAVLKVEGARLGYLFKQEPISGMIKVDRNPSRISSENLVVTQLDRDSLRSHLEAKIQIEGAGIRQLDVAISQNAGTDIRFYLRQTSGRITEQKELKTVNGNRIWRLRFDRRIKGNALLSLDVETEREESTDFSPHQISIQNIEREHGYVVIEARPEQRLSIQAKTPSQKPLDDVDPGNLPRTVATEKERIVASFHYINPNYQIVFNEEELERVSVPTAICHQSRYQTVLDQGGQSQHYAEYQLVAIGIQSLLINIPGTTELWATLVDGEPIEIRKTEKGYEVAITAVNPPGKSRKLELFYSTSENETKAFGTLKQLPPTISVIDGTGQIQTIEILKQQWSLHHPPTTMLVSSTGQFVSQSPMDRSGTMSWFQNQFQAVSKTSLLLKVIVLAVVLLSIVGVVKIFKKMSQLKVLFYFAGLGIVFMILVSLMLPAVQQSREAAIRTQLGNDTKQAELDELIEAESSNGQAGKEMKLEEPSVKENRSDLEKSIQLERNFEVSDVDVNDSAFEESEEVDSLELKYKNLAVKSGSGEVNGPGKQAGARLSVAVRFQTPDHWPEKEFQYLGTSGDSAESGLQIQYEDKNQSFLYRNIAVVFVILLCWFVRHRTKNLQVGAVLLCLILPLILMQVVPYHWYPILDGLFLGSILGGLMLCYLSTLQISRKAIQSIKGRTPVMPVLLFFAILFSATGLPAKDKPATKEISAPEINQVASQKQKNKTNTEVKNRSRIPDRSLIVKPAPFPKEKVLVVPYDDGEDPLKANRVFLPYDEYIRLWNRAYPEKPLEKEPPVKALVSGALYHASISSPESSKEKSILVKGRIVFQNLTDSRVSIAIPFKPPAIRKSELDGKPVSIQVVKIPGGIEHRVILSKAGLHILDIEFDVPAKITDHAGQFSLQLNSVPSGRFSLVLPEKNLNVTVKGIQPALINHHADDQAGVDFPVDRGGNYQVSWQPKQTGGSGDSTIHVSSSSVMSLDDTGIRLIASHDLRVRQGSLNRLEYQLPGELLIQKVTGEDVGGWKITGGDDDRKLEIFFRREVNDLTQFQVELYQNLQVVEEEEFSIPYFGPRNVTHETGEIGFYTISGLSLKVSKATNLKKIDRGNFKPRSDAGVSSKPVLAYRYSGSDFSLSGSVLRKVTKFKTRVTHGLEIREDSIQYAHQYQFEILDSPLDQISFSVPYGYQIKDIESPALEDWYLEEDDFGDLVLVVTFSTPQKGNLTLNLSGEVPLDLAEETTELVLPLTMAETKLNSELGIWIDDSLRAILENKNDWKQVDPQRLSKNLKKLKPTPIQYAFQSSDEEVGSVIFRLSRVKPQIQGSSASIVTLTDVLLNYQYAIKWKIVSGSSSHFSFIIPSEFKKYVEIQGSNIRQIKSTSFSPELTQWELFTQEPAKGEYFILVNINMPPVAEGKFNITSPILQQYKTAMEGELEPIALQQHYMVLVNQSYGQLTHKGKKVSSEIAPESIPIQIDQDLIRQALVVEQFSKPGAKTQYLYQRKIKEEGLPASVNQARLTSILEMDGSWRMQAVYRMKNLRRQFLAVRLPENSRLLSAFVASRPTRPTMTTINNEKVHLIPLPKTSEVDLAFDVNLTLAGELKEGSIPRGFSLVSRELEMPAPIVISQKDDPYYGIPVARTDWTLFLPENLEIVSSESGPGMNLQLSEEDLANFYRDRAVLNEVKELFEILEDEDTSDHLRFRCWSNLKQLEGQVRQQGKSASKGKSYRMITSSPASKIVRKNRDLREKVLSDYGINNSRIDKIDNNNQTITFQNESSQRVSGLGVEQQKYFFETQSKNLFLGNSIGIPEPVGKDLKGLNQNQFGFIVDQPAKPNLVDSQSQVAPRQELAKQRRKISQEEQRSQAVEFNDEINKRKSMNRKRPALKRKHRSNIDRDGVDFQKLDAESSPQDKLVDGLLKDLSDTKANESPVVNFTTKNGPDDFYRKHESNEKESDGISIIAGVPNSSGGVGGNLSPAKSKAWTSAGGISLPINLPEEGLSYSFQKVNGAPKLTLRVRNQKTTEYGIGVFWLIAWIVIAAISFLALLGRKEPKKVFPVLITLSGITLYLSMGTSLSLLGLIVFAIGVIWMVLQYQKTGSASPVA